MYNELPSPLACFEALSQRTPHGPQYSIFSHKPMRAVVERTWRPEDGLRWLEGCRQRDVFEEHRLWEVQITLQQKK